MKTMTMHDLTMLASDVIKRQKISGVKPICLTKSEQFALCFVAGIPMSFDTDYSNNILKATTVPTSICWDGERFKIFYNEKIP